MEKIKSEALVILKGVLTGIAVSLLLVIIASFLTGVLSVSDTTLKIVNQIIKVLSCFLACAFTVKGEKAFIKGGITGLLIFFFTYVFLGVISGVGITSMHVLVESCFGFLTGAISGVISVNVLKNRI